MKKIYALALLLSCSSTILYAQTVNRQTLLKLLRRSALSAAPAPEQVPVRKGTAAIERLSAQADYYDDNGSGTLSLEDSARFIYSGSRRSKFDHDDFNYINLYNLDYRNSTDFLYVEPIPNNRDSSDLPRVAFDTLYRYKIDTVSGDIFRSHVEVATFNPDTSFSTLTSRALSPAGVVLEGFRQAMVYNSSGRLSRVYAMELNGANYDTVAVRAIFYNGTGQVTKDSIAFISGSSSSTDETYYTYNSAGQYTTKFNVYFNGFSGTIDTVSRIINTYYPNGKLATQSYAYNNGNSLQLSYKDSLVYTPGVPGFTAFYEKSYDSTGAVDNEYSVVTSRINAQGLKDSLTASVKFLGFDIVVAAVRLTYNANGNPLTFTVTDRGSTTPKISNFTRWYYEQYPSGGGGTGVGTAPEAATVVRVYPNPTRGDIIISGAAINTPTAANVRIMNMAGQTLRAESVVLSGNPVQLSLGRDLPAGQYLVSVQDAAGRSLYAGTIVKE
jgi:hypothetical protein